MYHNNIERNIKLMSYFNFFTDFRFYSVFAIIYFTQITGSLTLGMSIFSIEKISSALSEVPTGVLSDIIGRKKTIIFGSIASVLSILFYLIGGDYYFLAIGAIFSGIASSFYSGNNETLIYNSLAQVGKTKKYGEVLGKTSSMFQLALMSSAVIGGLLIDYGFQIIFLLSLFSQIICFFISLFFIEPEKEERTGNAFLHLKDSFKTFWKNKLLRIVTAINGIRWSIGEAMHQFSAELVKLVWPLSAIGFLSIISNGFAFLGFRYGGKIVERFSVEKVILYCIFYGAIIDISMALTFGVHSPIFLESTGFTFGVITVAIGIFNQSHFSDKYRATMGSIGSLFNSICFSIIAIIVGMIGDIFGYINLLFIVGIFEILILLSYMYIFRKEKYNKL